MQSLEIPRLSCLCEYIICVEIVIFFLISILGILQHYAFFSKIFFQILIDFYVIMLYVIGMEQFRFGPRESKKAMMYSDIGRLNCNVSYTTFATSVRGQV